MCCRPAHVLTVLAAITVALASVLAGPAVALSETTASTAATAQEAEGVVSDVTLLSSEIEPGESATVEARVTNDGTEAGEIPVTLTLDGEEIETRTPTVDPEFPVIVTFDVSPEEPGTYSIAVNGVEADTELTVGDPDDQDESSEGEDTSDEEAEAGGEFVVGNVTLERSTIQPGESVRIGVEIENVGDEPGDFEAVLEVDGEVIEEETVPQIFPGNAPEHFFEFEPDGEGEYTISVNGVEADQPLTVEESGGFLAFLPWFVQPIVLFVVLPILLVYLALKALAIYLGY